MKYELPLIGRTSISPNWIEPFWDLKVRGDETMNLFEIINITQLKKDYQIESFTLVDFTLDLTILFTCFFQKTILKE